MLTGQWMSTKNTGSGDVLINIDTASDIETARDKQMDCRGFGTKVAALLDGKRVETVKVEMSDLTQYMYKGIHRISSSEEDKYCVTSRKNPKRRRYNYQVNQIKCPQLSNQNRIPRRCHHWHHLA